MQLSDIQNQPAELSNLLPRTRQNGDTKEYTAQFRVAFNYSDNIFGILAMPGENIDISFLWDEEGLPKSSIPYVPFSREFDSHLLTFARNDKEVLAFPCEKLHKFRVTAKAGEQLEVSFLAFGLTSTKANTSAIHKLVKDPSITLSISPAPGGQESL